MHGRSIETPQHGDQMQKSLSQIDIWINLWIFQDKISSSFHLDREEGYALE